MLSETQIKSICAKYGIVPSKSKGQNFLIDTDVVSKIIIASNINSGDTVMEVGPGVGVLTGELLKVSGKLLAIELDRNACDFLQAEFGKDSKFELIEKDILRLNKSEAGLENFGYKVVANLPYNITSKFLRLFLEQEPKPSEMILMVQYEVAERIVAPAGEMSLLSLSAQFYSEAEIVFQVKRNSFWPAPKVDSAVIRLKLKEKLPKIDSKLFFRMAKIGFSSRRKQLHNNLSVGLKISSVEAKEAIKTCGFDEKIRAQDLSVENWIRLANILNYGEQSKN
ncbi:MAG: 16S rRNA (adenine(1518)-N(6)/adenine(1519)-N(6))-dimethyltransferase RsmA [Patescibacteria group bacterium]|jgi:16S rRNA (adenine1518-N6/adenine1519-N6)-dimethyltransferase